MEAPSVVIYTTTPVALKGIVKGSEVYIADRNGKMQPSDFLDEFLTELKAQLISDNMRWGDTWLKRPKKGQADRAFVRFREYYGDERLACKLAPVGDVEEPIFVDSLPWLKIAGEALIGWIRERYPEHFPDY